MVFYGKGEMLSCYFDYPSQVITTPWKSYGPTLKNIIIEEGVTNIGSHAFYYHYPDRGYQNIKNVRIN